MPHKRAKLSTRQSERTKRGADLPPTGGVPLAQEIVPKSMARVLQAERVRMMYRDKRALDDEDGEGQRNTKRRKKGGEMQKPAGIKHGESLVQYNRRVEDEMRIQVAEAMHMSRNSTKRARKIDQAAAIAKSAVVVASKSTPATSKETAPTPTRKTEFDSRERTTRLNDIVQAPPSLTKLPRGVSKQKAQSGAVASHKADVVSMAQKQRMEEERERAIKRYRELKSLRDSTQVK
ncbi:hypothetical protein JB92DRAFT_3127464 [Gautieria morchelliformis]|nr:hypothetical protein JB92DRAFT_3127464 [Gautieria morchelliformis]